MTILESNLHDDAPTTSEPLPGDLAIWIFIFAELLVFGILFIAYAFARAQHAALFAHEQASLPRLWGLLDTLILITSSYAVAQATHAIHQGHQRRCASWLVTAEILGVTFIVLKIMEFIHDAQIGISLSRNLFDMFYLTLTGFHFLHVLMGLIILSTVTIKTFQGAYSSDHYAGIETGAAFWHMVDLVWIILFVLIYVLH
ncbi:MAG: cytochrome c oxidase subunit 3 family protein [Pseudomonadales bacterium]|nr:cytochrome c oxidase subunit 3 family protein [Pseudomonadales bacterium]